MKKTNCFFYLFTFYVLRLCGQADSLPAEKIYRVNRLTVSIVIVAGSVADFLAIKPLRDKPLITESEFNSLNPDVLHSFDSWALEQNPADRKKFQQIADYSQIPYFLIPEAMFAINKKMRKDWLNISLMYWEGHTITFFSYNYGFFGPRFQNSFRPVVYYDEFPIEERNIGYNRSSFYSGHTASVTYTAFFTAKIYSDYHPELGIKKYLLFAAALVPSAAMGYLRVKSLDHFPSECMVGMMIGATVGIAVPEFHKLHKKDVSIGMFSSPEGTGFTMRWKFSERHKVQ